MSLEVCFLLENVDPDSIKPFYESKHGNELTSDPWEAMRFQTATEAVDYLEKESLLGILTPIEHGFEDEEI
jgi:hypothetical protein